MLKTFERARGLPDKLAGQIRQLHRDPERFARNLLQFTNPARFEERLIDVLHESPIAVRFDPGLDAPLRLNVLDTAWTRSGMTGGPNTAINLAARVAREGIAVRLVATVQPSVVDPAWFRRHVAALAGDTRLPDLSIASATAAAPLSLGPKDVFLATHWATARQLKTVLPGLPIQQFFYLLQEFEPGFYAWSSNYARAIETYGMDFWPVINQALLADYLLSLPFGRMGDPITRERALIFEPAVDATVFHPGPDTASLPRPKRLLFYGRPHNTRNLFGLGLMALREAVGDPAFQGWEFLCIGSRGGVPDNLALGHGHVLREAPWFDYAGYGDLLRGADLLLCPMLSPHTSYPVLEMAACGGLSVTNVFATKTRARLEDLSANIIAVEATVAAFAEGLRQGARTVNGAAPRQASLNMARDWDLALDPVARRIAAIMAGMAKADR